jgi:membrane fusion protein, multidrug efflux system
MRTQNLFLTLLIICASFLFNGCNSRHEDADIKPVDVNIEQVKNLSEGNAIPYSGTIEESETIPLSFATVGTVARVFVAEGDFVKKGKLLAELNEETSKNSYEMSLASQKQAEDAYNRLLPMYKNGNLPEVKLVEIETSLQKAKSAAAIAKKNLDDCKLYSTVNGIVGKRAIDPGMTAMPNLTSIKIVKIEKVFARIPVSENEISLVKKGQKANIKIAALDNSEFTGTVEEIGVLADPMARTYKIKIGINNSKLQIKPGMVCNVVLSNNKIKEGVVAPNRAVMVDENGRNYVYTVNTAENKAIRKYVKTGKMLSNGIEILEGLNAGETIVVAGQHKLIDNALVHIVNN